MQALVKLSTQLKIVLLLLLRLLQSCERGNRSKSEGTNSPGLSNANQHPLSHPRGWRRGGCRLRIGCGELMTAPHFHISSLAATLKTIWLNQPCEHIAMSFKDMTFVFGASSIRRHLRGIMYNFNDWDHNWPLLQM